MIFISGAQLTGNFLTMFFFFFTNWSQVSILSSKRSMNIGIFLKQFKRWVSGGTLKVCWFLTTLLAFQWKDLGETSKSFVSGQAWSTLLYCPNRLRHRSNTLLLLLKHIYCLRLHIRKKQIQMKISQDHFMIKRFLEFNCKTTSMTKPWIRLYLHPQACKRHGWRNQIRKWAQFWLWKTAGAVQAAAWWTRGSCPSLAVFVMHPP